MTDTIDITPEDQPDSQKPPLNLFYPGDPAYLHLLLTELIRRKYYMRRPSKYHIKHRDVNFFWTTGVITTDDGVRHPEKGQFAFVALIEKLYPKTSPTPDASSDDSRPSPLIIDFGLDDEDDPVKGVHVTESDEDDKPW